MKSCLTKTIAIAAAAACIYGCKHISCSQKMSTESAVYESTEAPQPKFFADEEYVWESWQLGTNRVYKIDDLDK